MIAKTQNSIPQVKITSIYNWKFLLHFKDQSVDQRNHLLDIALVSGQCPGCKALLRYIALHLPLICPYKTIHLAL